MSSNFNFFFFKSSFAFFPSFLRLYNVGCFYILSVIYHNEVNSFASTDIVVNGKNLLICGHKISVDKTFVTM